MKTSIFLCLYVSFMVCYGNTEEEDKTFNNIFAIDGECLKERSGVKCPKLKTSHSELEECFNPSKAETRFYLYTRKNKQHPEMLHKCGGMLPKNSHFNHKRRVVILIHGMCDGVCRSAGPRETKDQLLYRDDYNVILVDWTKDNLPDIAAGTWAAKKIAKRICCVVKNILALYSGIKRKIHFIAHSAGAHIAGFASRCIGRARRISGIDPFNAGAFYNPQPKERLRREDADIVDVIHTNAGCCIGKNLKVGYPSPIGDADFYPNGGSVQESYYSKLLTYFLKQDYYSGMWALIHEFGYHLQGWEYYKISVNPCYCEFIGVQCRNCKDAIQGNCSKLCKSNGSNCAVMGMDYEYYIPDDEYHGKAKHKPSKIYYLKTGYHCDYCDNRGIKTNGFPKSAQRGKGPGRHCFTVQQ